MCLLWKKYDNIKKIKGIIIFTHKEIKTNGIPYNKLKKKYFLGIHIGCYYDRKIPNFIDFIMSGPTQIVNNKNKFLIPYNSRNFLPDYFHIDKNKSKKTLIESIHSICNLCNYDNKINLINDINNCTVDKYWDFIVVCKPVKSCKHIDKFLYNLKKVMEIKKVKALIISAISPNEKKDSKSFHNIKNIIDNTFTNYEKDNITLFRPDLNTNEGADNNIIYPFYQWSKIYCYFSSIEGESRVVHEALCTGLPIIYYKNVIGGSDYYLNNKNSISFDDYNNAYIKMVECLNNFKIKNEDYLEVREKLIDKYSVKNIMKYFDILYKKNNIKFDNKLIEYDQLHFRLPAHYYNDKWAKYSNNETSDILNINQWKIFEKEFLIE